MRNSGKSVFEISLMLLLVPALAIAQSSVPPPPSAGTAAPNAAGSEVEEVVVTATRRSVNLQEVPGTIEAVSANTLADLNVKGTEGLAQLVPGLAVTRSGGLIPYIRGVGTANSGFTTETPVGIYIDGLYLPNSSGGLFSFNNIERIEVLKGPQGTLYGRNTTAGLINIVTRDPEEGRHVDASAGYANYNTLTLNFYGDISLSDNLFASVAYYHSKQADGWGRNVFNGNSNLTADETGVQAKLLWNPAVGTRITLSGIYDYNNTDEGVIVAIFPGTVGIDGTPFLGNYRNAARRDSSAPYYGSISSLKIEQDFDFAKLMSLTGYQAAHQLITFTQTGIPGNPVAGQGATEANIYGQNKTFSQEFQLSSRSTDSPFDWIIGAFYYHDDTVSGGAAFQTCVGNVCAPGVPTNTFGYPTTRSYSGYGDGTYKIFDATHLTLGIRYTRDVKGLTGLLQPLQGLPNSVAALPATAVLRPGDPYPGNPNGIPTSSTFPKVTFRGVVAQDLTKDIHAYVSFNRGFRSGTYNTTVFTNPPSRPETLDAWEVGLKTELLERRLRLNLAAFYYDYTDIQVRSAAGAPPGSSILSNAGAAHVQGIDADFSVFPIRDLSINGGFEYLNAKYVSYPGATCTSILPTGKIASAACDLSGYALPNAPKYSITLGFTYNFETALGPFSLNANDSYRPPYSMAADGSLRQSTHHLISSSLTWRDPRGQYDIRLFVKNLTNEYYFAGAQAGVGGNDLYTPGAPRTYGVTFGYHY